MTTEQMVNNVVGGLVAIKMIEVSADMLNKTAKPRKKGQKKKGLLL
jgi:hypothetical protein